ncbi:TPA: DUF4123 domain-containing protein [Citrobacter farmeri]|uniref:DUF4123 domain-containing protein n=1 Tax=Citrobacter farmeri TaxID=67824 RepID=UPI002AB5C2CD|nr:DUF4123 domain-containing protein [Citrobacter farmeri]
MSNIDSFSIIRDELSHTIFERNGKAFLLIDATLEHYDSETELFERLKAHNVYPLTFAHPQVDGVLPLLLILLEQRDSNSQALLDLSIRTALEEITPEKLKQGNGRSVCAWISSQLNLEQLSSFISNTAIQHISDVGDVLIRFFDPSVLGALLDILDSWQRQRLLDNTDLWCYIDGDGTLQSVNNDGNAKKLSYSLGLTKDDFLEFQNIETINKILLVYRAKEKQITLSEIQMIRLLRPALRFFSEHFVGTNDDVVEFGVDILNSKRNFYLSPVFSTYFSVNNQSNKRHYKEFKSISGSIRW